MDIYDADGVKRCTIEDPVKDLICKTTSASLYRVIGYDGPEGTPFEAILEMSASWRQYLLLDGRKGDFFLRIVRKNPLASQLDDFRSATAAGNPSATLERLFPIQTASFTMSADWEARAAALLQIKGRDWEYLIPLSALAQDYFHGSPSSFVHLMIDYACIIEALFYGNWARAANPDFIWVDTRNSQLIYLGGATQYSPIGVERDSTMDADYAFSVASSLFAEWLDKAPVWQGDHKLVEKNAVEELAKPLGEEIDFEGKSRTLFKYLCAESGCCSINDEDRRLAVEQAPPCIIPTRGGGDTILSRSFFYSRQERRTS